MSTEMRDSRAEANKALVRRLNAAIERGDLDEVSQILSPELIHDRRGLEATFPFIMRGQPKPRSTQDAFRAATLAIKSTFEGWHAEEVVTYCDNDTVIARQSMSGRVKGLFPGADKAEATFEFPMVVIFTIRDNRVVRIWALGDELGFWRQIGMQVPPPPN